MADPRDIEGRTFQPALLRGGLNLTDSKFDVFAGSLQGCLNYESTEQGYSRSKGLFFFDGLYDRAVENMWYITTTTGVGGESTLTGSGFKLGGQVTISGISTATVVYWVVKAGTPDTVTVGLTDLQGFPPESGDSIVDAATATTLDLAPTMATEPTTLIESSIADTVQEYLDFLNLEVNSRLCSQDRIPGFYRQRGKPPGIGSITGGFQFEDDVYVMREYYSIGFENGVTELYPGDSIAIPLSGDQAFAVGTIANIAVTSGTWAEGNATGVYSLTGTLPYVSWVPSLSVALQQLVLYNNTVYVCHTPNSDLTFDVTNYDVHDTQALLTEATTASDIHEYMGAKVSEVVSVTSNKAGKSALWKSTIDGWEAVDQGYSLGFQDGMNAPSVRDAPLFVDNMIASTKDTGAQDWISVSGLGNLPAIGWGNASQASVSDNLYATVTLPVDGDKSELLNGIITSTGIPSENVRILGIKAVVEGQETAGGNAVISSIKLYNDNTESWYSSKEKAINESLNNGADAFYTYGGSNDLWGVSEIKASDLIAGNIRLRLECERDDAVTTPTVAIDNIAVTVYYVSEVEHVYVYDGTTDVSEADITAWQVTNGVTQWRPGGTVAEVVATGSVILTGGGSGSVDSVIVGGVSLLSASVPFNTTLAQTATDVAANITANTTNPNYTAAAVGSTITISAAAGTGSSPNGLDVTSVCTTITSTDIDMANGVTAVTTLPDGLFNLYNVTSPGDIKSGMTMWTGPLGTGLQIATVKTVPEYNWLPNEDDLEAAGSQCQTIKANFFADADANAIYGVNGVTPAFTYNGNFFSYIRTPLLASADKPRHIAFHVNMLALGYSTGHVLLSTVGAPHDFSAATGGTSWGFKEGVTGLVELPGDTLGVVTVGSVSTLTGTDPSSMTQKNVQPNAGCIEYSLQRNTEPYFLDFHGVSSLSTTQRFGDFNFGRVSDPIVPLLEDRAQSYGNTDVEDVRMATTVTVRNKNQYRIYYRDGYIITATFFESRDPEFTVQHYEPDGPGIGYVPTWIDSTILSDGRERIIMGNASGSVYVVDGANCIHERGTLFEGDPLFSYNSLESYFITNPINLGRPETATKYHHVVVQGQFYGWQNIEAWADSSYVFDATGDAHATCDLGSPTSPAVIKSTNNVDSLYLPLLADGYSIKLKTELDGSKPHTLQSLLFRATLKGTDRTRTPKAY